MAGYVGEKCGVKFKPLSLVMLYRSSKEGKLRKRMMPLRELDEFVDMDSYAQHLCQHERHGAYLRLLPHAQLVSLLERAKEGPGSIGRKPIPHLTLSKPSTFDGSVVPFQEKTNRPLQPLSDSKAAEGKTHSELLDLSSLPTLGRQPLSAQRPLPTAQLDEKSLDDLLQDISGLSEESPKENPSRSAASRKKEDDFHSDFEDDAVGNEFEDLNLAPDEVVKQKKKEMDVLFESNRIRPGDEGWQYDKEVDFGGSDVEGKLSCGWDNESGEDSDLVF